MTPAKKPKRLWAVTVAHEWGELRNLRGGKCIMVDGPPYWIAAFTSKRAARRWAGKDAKLMQFDVVKP